MIEEEKAVTPEIKAGLIKKFEMETSPDFTEKVMLEVNAVQKERSAYFKVMIIVLFSFTCLAWIVFTGDFKRMEIISINPNPIFGIIQKLIFMLKPVFVSFIIFSISTTIFLDLLIKRLIHKKIHY